MSDPNSSEKHLETIEKLSNNIKFFVVEKPVVENLQEIKKLNTIIDQKNIKIFEVSQYLFDEINKLKSVKKAKILVRKRIFEDYLTIKKIRLRINQSYLDNYRIGTMLQKLLE